VVGVGFFKSALKKAKNRKAPGSNGIIIEQYKLLNDENLTFTILEILNNYLNLQEYDIEDCWHKVTLELLPKKGDLSLLKNYRPISLLDVLSKYSLKYLPAASLSSAISGAILCSIPPALF
jgi:hypothetical protein